MPIKAVVFDLDGTLVDQEGAERDALKALFDGQIELDPKPTFHVFLRTWRNIADEHLQRFLDNKMGFDEQRVARFLDICEHFGKPISREQAVKHHRDYMDHYQREWRPYGETVGVLEELKSAGYRLAVITNGDSTQQRAKLDATALTARFELIVVSGDIKIAKPLRGIFDHAAQVLGLAAAECCYVGDRFETDALGARDAGWRAVWLNRLLMPGDATDGVTTIQNLAELPSLLAKG